jgi:nitrite reductase/ring-hydroxylating ferredoxin subunit/uncharacterized membrane protein
MLIHDEHGDAGHHRERGSLVDSVVGAIERADVVDRASEALRPFVGRVIGEGAARDLATGRWLGHPVHPAAVSVPLACWFGSSMLDLIGGNDARGAARRLVGLGVVATVPVAATGAADWFDTDGAEQRVGTVHALAMSATAAIYGWSWLERRRGRHGRGLALGAVATAMMGAGAFLGGHLTYRRGVGVDTTAFQSGPEEWAELQVTGDVSPLGPVAADVDGVAFAVVGRTGPAEPPYVLEARCTHRGGPLHEGTTADGCITCPWHGSRFELATGAVRSGPASVPQPVYEVRASEGAVSIRRAEPGGLRRNPISGPSR